MHYIPAKQGQIFSIEEVFPDATLYKHGKFKVGFGDPDEEFNPTDVSILIENGGQLLEVADWSAGGSSESNTLGGDRDITVTDLSSGKVLGVLEYRNGDQPHLKVNNEKVEGGASRFSSFVSKTGAAAEDPKPRAIRDDTHGGEEWYVNRETGQAAYGRYLVRINRLNVNEGQAYAPLALEMAGHNPETETTYTANASGYCGSCGEAY